MQLKCDDSDQERSKRRRLNIQSFLDDGVQATLGVETCEILKKKLSTVAPSSGGKNQQEIYLHASLSLAAISKTAADLASKEKLKLQSLLNEYLEMRQEQMILQSKLINRIDKIIEVDLKRQESNRKELQIRRSELIYIQNHS